MAITAITHYYGKGEGAVVAYLRALEADSRRWQATHCESCGDEATTHPYVIQLAPVPGADETHVRLCPRCAWMAAVGWTATYGISSPLASAPRGAGAREVVRQLDVITEALEWGAYRDERGVLWEDASRRYLYQGGNIIDGRPMPA